MSPDPALQHGALRAVSELTFALYELDSSSTLQQTLGDDIIAQLLDIAPKVSIGYTLHCKTLNKSLRAGSVVEHLSTAIT